MHAHGANGTHPHHMCEINYGKTDTVVPVVHLVLSGLSGFVGYTGSEQYCSSPSQGSNA